MAALCKLGIILGAGIVGSIIAKDGGSSSVTNIFSGALKLVTKSLQADKNNSKSTSTAQDELIFAQINSIRDELKHLASSGTVTIVNGGSSGSGSYRITTLIVVGTLGYGFIWWKGWKFSGLMFVTRRGFSEACSNIGSQLDAVSNSIKSVRQHLFSRINVVDSNVHECKKVTAGTQEVVSDLRGKLTGCHEDVESVKCVVQDLETKLDQIEWKQKYTTQGVKRLCLAVDRLQHRGDADLLQVSPSSYSQRSIELPQALQITKTGSLPPLQLQPPSPSAPTEAPIVGISTAVQTGILRSSSAKAGAPSDSPFSDAPNGTGSSFAAESNCSTSSSSRFGWMLPSMSILTRSHSTKG